MIANRYVLALLVALAIPLGATSAAATQDTPSSRPESGFVGAVDPSSIIITTASGWALADVVGDAPVTQRGRYLLVDVAPGKTPQEAVATWTGRPGVETASVRYRYEMSGQVVPAAVPNDPLYGDQPNFDAVQAPAAWDTSTGAGSVVAVIDSGVSPGNDLACHTFVSEYDAVLDLAGPGTAFDEIAHGTHVTGTVAQCTNNGIGVAGIAPNATVMPINVFFSDGSTTGELVAIGMDWAVDHGADIITMSLGIPCFGADFASCQDPAVNAAIARAKAANVLLVAATGNETQLTQNYPANHPDVMGIGAVNINNAKAAYSNSGPGISMTAPGGDGLKGILQQTFIFNGSGVRVFDYYYYEGTSMATPHVAGAAAILKSAVPSATAAQIRAALECSALDLGPSGVDNLYGAGLLQIDKALDALQASGSGTGACAPSHVGLVDIGTGQWHLLNSAGSASPFFFGNPGDLPFVGDWNCDGIETPGLYRQADGFVYLRNSNTQGPADLEFFFGDPGDVPLSGDFNGDGCDTVSIYRPSQAQIFIVNALGQDGGGLGQADYAYFFGNVGDKPVVGDFNGNGTDTVGLHRESTGFVYYRNTNTTGNAHAEFFFGDPGDRIVAADWNDNGSESMGIFRPSNTTLYLRYTNTQGNANEVVTYGDSDWIPVAGDFAP